MCQGLKKHIQQYTCKVCPFLCMLSFNKAPKSYKETGWDRPVPFGGFCASALMLQDGVGPGRGSQGLGQGSEKTQRRGDRCRRRGEAAHVTYSADGLSCVEVPGTQHVIVYRIGIVVGIWPLEIRCTNLTVHDTNLSLLQRVGSRQEPCVLGGERFRCGVYPGRETSSLPNLPANRDAISSSCQD